MRPETQAALVNAFDGFERPVEVGLGRSPGVAAALARRGATVTATDIVARDAPAEVRFVIDDATAPDWPVYEGAELIYALNCPPELHEPVRRLADGVGAACRLTTLGTEPVTVPATARQLPGETLYSVRTQRP
ncbi:MAG: UPF0146 family protein [Halobacteriaceae archaeon]